MSLYGEEKLNLEFYSASLCNSDTCAGNGSVFRVSFILFIFELLHVLIIGAGAVSFHWVWFAVKFLVFVIALTLTFVIGDSSDSNDFFDGYADYFARYISAIYLLLQILILISWGYKMNEYLQEKGNESAEPNNPDQDEDEQSSSCNPYFWTLGLSSFGLYALSFTLCGFFFSWYGSNSSCTAHRTLISLTIVISLVNATISGVRGDGSFFVSAVVSFYCTFLCFAALQSDDDKQCNIWNEDRDSASLWVGYLITFLAIFYAAFRADQIGILWETDDEDAEMEQPLLSSDKKESKDVEKGNEKDDNDNNNDDNANDDIVNDTSNYDDDKNKSVQKTPTNESDEKMPSKQVQRISNVYFHIVMMLAACYMAMLFSNWGTNSDNLTTTGKASMWVNIVSQYMTAFLFWWTLLAPVICPSRFAQENEDDD